MKHWHIVNRANVEVEKINAPEGSAFGGLRQRIGARIGRKPQLFPNGI